LIEGTDNLFGCQSVWKTKGSLPGRAGDLKTYIPESDDGSLIIVIEPAILGVFPQIIKIDGCIHTAKEDLNFLLIKHPVKERKNMGEAMLRRRKRNQVTT
jgi:hypothetical protein